MREGIKHKKVMIKREPSIETVVLRVAVCVTTSSAPTIKKLVSEMKEYEDLPKELKVRIEAICSSDPYGLSPATLYRNIYASSGSDEQLAHLFEVMPSLVRAIKES